MRLSDPRRLPILLALGPLLLGVGCTDRETVTGAGPLPVAATAYPSPASRNEPVAKNAPQDIQEIAVTISDGKFDADIYDAQRRAARLRITTRGGPYTFSIDKLLEPRQLPADQTTDVGVNLPDPGQYTMRLGGSGATATLNVRPAGSR